MKFVFLFLSLFLSLVLRSQERKEAMLHFYAKFYDPEGQPLSIGKFKQWQRDSTFVQQAYTYKVVTNAKNETTVQLIPGKYRFINLKTNSYYDYKFFSKKAVCIKKDKLPESSFKDVGWAFYSDKNIQIEGTPEMLTDTTINNQLFKRAKFYLKGYDSLQIYSIGLFPEGVPYSILSIEKKFSKSQDWFLMKKMDYAKGANHPYAIFEIEFLSHKLTKAENEVLDVWEKFARAHPVSDK